MPISHTKTNQVDELRVRVRELEERERKESKKLADEDALRKIRVAEETIDHLQKKLTATKQVDLDNHTNKVIMRFCNLNWYIIRYWYISRY